MLENREPLLLYDFREYIKPKVSLFSWKVFEYPR